MADQPDPKYLQAVLKAFNPCGDREFPEDQCRFFRPCTQLNRETNGQYLCVPRLTYDAIHNLNNGEEPQETYDWIRRCLQARLDRPVILQPGEAWIVRTLDKARLEVLVKEVYERAIEHLCAGKTEAFFLWMEVDMERRLEEKILKYEMN